MSNSKWGLITGASKGIGKEIAWEFVRQKWNVILVARSQALLEELAREMQSKGVAVLVIAADLTKIEEREKVVNVVQSKNIPLCALVNNAGFGSAGPFASLDRMWELSQIELNIAALVDLSKLFIPLLSMQSQSYILNIASTAAFQPGPYMATYYATKSFVLHFSEALSIELADTSISVTAHCPGATESEFAQVAGTDKALLGKPSFHTMSAEVVARSAISSMLKRKRVAIPGILNRLLAFSVRLTPRFVILQITKRLNRPS